MPKCRKCKNEKAVSEMARWGGKPGKVCLECKNGKAPETPPAKPPADDPIEFTVEASLGFSVKVDGGRLVITQDNPERPETPDNITLTMAEARTFLELVEKWAAAA